MRRLAAAILISVLVFLAGEEQSQAHARAQRPVVLLFHGGGLMLRDAALMDILEPAVRAVDMKPVSVDYALFDFPQAFADAEAAARRYRSRTVYAYGESAGGTLAGWLAARRLVRAAAGNSAVVNLTAWLRPFMTSEEPLPPPYNAITQGEFFEQVSGGMRFVHQHSLQHLHGAPLRLYGNCLDTEVPCQVAKKYARHYRPVSWRGGAGVGHIGARVPTAIRALSWMRSKAPHKFGG